MTIQFIFAVIGVFLGYLSVFWGIPYFIFILSPCELWNRETRNDFLKMVAVLHGIIIIGFYVLWAFIFLIDRT